MITIKQYFMNFVENKNTQFEGAWGWFVDIEANNYNGISRLHNKYPKQIVRNINIPSTIKEIPSIKSVNSIHDLKDSSMIFEMDEDYYKRIYNKKTKISGNTINIFCIFGILCIFYGCLVL